MSTVTIFSQQHNTPLGKITIAATDTGVCLLEFSSQAERLTRATKDVKKRLNQDIVNQTNPHIEQTKRELHEYFSGQRQRFTVTLDPQGTDFQQSVWQSLLAIPYGQTISYAQQAAAINNPSAVRAVANANGANKIAILIPCHRVIGSNGKLTGYGGGLTRKQALLDLERNM